MEIQANSVASSLIKEARDSREASAKGAGQSDAGKAGGAGGTGGTRVALSDKARSMVALRSAVDAAPDVREGRVAELSQKIAAGTYDIKGQVVAQAMLRHAAFEAIA